MSGTAGRQRTPFVAPITGSDEQQLAQIAQAINAKSAPQAWPYMLLVDPSGATWRVSVTTTGILQTTQVVR